MFDGLKEKLGRFSEDVEEDVDEEAVEEEPVDADDADAADAEAQTADSAASDAADSEGEPDAAPEPDDAAADDAEAAGVEADETETSGAEPEDAEAEPEAEPEPEADEDEDEDESASDDDDGRSLGERAKLLATGKTVIDEDDLESHLDDLELALLQSDVEMGVAQEILDGVEENLVGETRRRLSSTGNLVRDALREALYDVISVGQFDFDERVAEADKPVVIVFTGVNGVGKTTTIAKLSQYFEDRGLSTVLANGDTYRAGANEQLQQHADALGKEVISHEQGSDPAAVIYDAVEYADAHDVDVVLGDTAGRLHTSDGLMDQLSKIDRVTDPDLTLFVDEAVAGQDAVNRAREFDDAAAIDGAVLTKADADPQGGAAISIAHVTGKPILFLGTGQDYDDLERFDPEEIVDRLIGED
ncbi:signal recognition particle-docking protein FtsY [Halosimplex amylolyticum]|uniref:signal recognition particle-docking protein FtsY n=1 Tax=Halosimplex amylolyticum TaxID=3396616 RepID=UPI003F562182